MKYRSGASVFGWLGVFLLTLALSCSAYGLTSEELKARVEKATTQLKDVTMTVSITYQNRKALEKIDSAYSRMYEFKSANISFKPPDKMRVDGKLGMVRFEMIVVGTTRIVRAPKLKINAKNEYSSAPSKVQTPLDMGFVTPALWKNRTIEVLDDPEAAAAGEIKIRMQWPNNTMVNLAWLDAKNLWIKRFEKRDSSNKLLVKLAFANPKQIAEGMWFPTSVDIFAPDGEKAGASQASDIKVNSGLGDSLFE